MLGRGSNIPSPIIWQPPQTGEYTTGLLNARQSSSGTMTADTLWAVPCVLPTAGSYSDMRIRVDTGNAGANARLGVYADDGSGSPGALIEEAGTFTPTAAAFYEVDFAAPRILGPGLLWLAMLTDDAVVSWEKSQIGLYAVNVKENGTNMDHVAMISRVFSYAALPDPFGTPVRTGIRQPIRVVLKAA